MGSQRRMAEDLMEHFLLTEDQAWNLVAKCDGVQIGDELSDAIYSLREGSPGKAIDDLRTLHLQLGVLIGELADIVSDLVPRRSQ